MSSIETHTIPAADQMGQYEHDRLILRKFVATRSDEAFAALFHRYHAFVYAVCMREIRDPELAADAAQIVFIALARKASAIRRGTALSAWLFQAARFAARDLARKERFRLTREQSAIEDQARRQDQQSAAWEEAAWRRADPALNQALARLSPSERLAVLLRYFDGLSLTECALALGSTPDGARMRIGRALGKMRRHLERCGVVLSMTALAAMLARHADAAVPGPAATPALCQLAPTVHVQAAKGVLFKMNALLWKPVIASVLAVGAALSSPVVAPYATRSFHRIVSWRRPEFYRTAGQSASQAAPMSSGSLAIDLFTAQSAGSLPQTFMIYKLPLRDAGSVHPRTSAPTTEDLDVIYSLNGERSDLTSVRRDVPEELLPAEARALLQQLGAQTVDEDGSSGTKKILNSLRSLQKRYTVGDRLDEAAAVREGIADFKLRMAGVLADPGSLTAYRENVGRSYLFSVVGSAVSPQKNANRMFFLDSTTRLGAVFGDANMAVNPPVEPDQASQAAGTDTTEILIRRLGLNERGETRDYTLPLGFPLTSATIWGTDIYTDDSPLAAVAVHAGLLSEGQKGIVKVTIFAGRDEYAGSERNGVVSSAYGSWGGSYMVEKAPGLESTKPTKLPVEAGTLLAELGAPGSADEGLFSHTLDGLRRLKSSAERADKLDDALILRDAVASIIAGRIGARPDPVSLTEYRGQNGRRIAFQVTGRTNGSIWGSDTYTDDSDLGTAAVHSGLLKPGQSGIVQVTILPGRDSYPGIRRNGVGTSPYGAWTGSYTVELVAVY